ncbi:sensor histidine kinase [Clostridium sp. BNL1100]|uniref:sensor histidine kinase n=1 Tax=Clostridium sp. BNL1100 TaxID=755731 RepID=UPI00024A734D|nr:sensor histidine kinase [Clostridium sp. BNL1100]AEY64631.1 putative signal transduction protein with a C-terminal ATPase domain [Clostridium sp. BNL1100]
MGKKRFFSLQYKVLLFSFIIIIIPITVLGIISFVKSSQILQQKLAISNMNTVKQIGNNIEFIVENIGDTSLYLIQNEDVREFLKLRSDEPTEIITKKKIKIETDLMQLLASKSFVNSIYIKGFNNFELNTAGTRNEIDSTTIDKVSGLRGKSMWYINKVVNYNDKSTNVFSMIRIINDVANVSSKLAILKINIEENAFFNIYKDKIIGKGDNFFIIDNEGIVISATNKSKIGQKFENNDFGINSLDSMEDYFNYSRNGINYLVTYYTIDSLGWKVVNMVPMQELLKENIRTQSAILSAMIISFSVCVIIAILFSKGILRRLKKLYKMMGRLENEDFDVYVEPQGNDEITLLSRNFNKMSTTLKELIQKVYTVQIKQKEAELRALQAQINPHFLYNTLDNIYWMGRMEKAYETCTLVEALSKLFRLSLNSGNETTTVKREIEHVKNYIVIQQSRYKDMIKFSLHVDPEVLECVTLKLVLQPLIENSIVHGIEKKGESGEIDITVRQEDNKLVFIISDNGYGVNLEEIQQLLDKTTENNKGLAIKNVNDRIRLYYGDKYGLEFFNRVCGTTAVITQPYSMEAMEE